MKKYTNLDLLRSLAVLSVVALHLWRQCFEFHLCAYHPGIQQLLHNLSYTGVMFFFVHTCLVLMLSMHRSPTFHRARSFLIRRAFRIYPLCWATILLVLATGLTDLHTADFRALSWQVIAANLLLLQNIRSTIPDVVGPLWSLPWEVQMYLVLPLFFAVLRRFDRLFVVFALWLGATIFALVATQPLIPRALHLHVAVFPPMFIGGMVAYKLLIAKPQGRGGLPAWSWPLFVLGLFSLQAALVGEQWVESPYGAGVDACICLALGIGIPAFDELRAGWIVHPAEQIAKYSYGVYLLHVPALIFVLRYLPGLPLALKVVVFLLLTALFSFISFHAIEDPLIQLGKRLTRASTPTRETPFAGGARTFSADGPTLATPMVGEETVSTPQARTISD